MIPEWFISVCDLEPIIPSRDEVCGTCGCSPCVMDESDHDLAVFEAMAEEVAERFR